MEITLLGTGCPVVSADRFGPANWVEHNGTHLLVDCGSGVTQRMVAAGRTAREIDAVLLTHLHSDHIVDLFQLIISGWHQGRDAPVRVLGPAGTREHVDRLMELWRPELERRIAYERRASTRGLTVVVEEVDARERLEFGDLAVEVVEVDHGPVKPAFGFVFEADGRRLAISGDTRYCPALIEAAQGVDVLVHEVYLHRDMPPPGGLRTAEGLANVEAYHTRSDEVGRVARQCGAGTLVLTHFVPPVFDEAALRTEIATSYGGTVVVGEDLMRIEVGGS